MKYLLFHLLNNLMLYIQLYRIIFAITLYKNEFFFSRTKEEHVNANPLGGFARQKRIRIRVC